MSQGFTKPYPTPIPVNMGGTGVITSTGSGSVVLNISPSLVTPNLGVATATSLVFSPTTSGILGVADGSNAAAGVVGEFVQNLLAGTTALSNNVYVIAAQLNLTAGDWDVWGTATFAGNPTATASQYVANIANAPGSSATYSQTVFSNLSSISTNPQTLNTTISRINLSSSASVYLNCAAVFSVGAINLVASTSILARRVR